MIDEQTNNFHKFCINLEEIIYHKSASFPKRFLLLLPDYKRAFKNFTKQMIFYFKGREVLPQNKLKILILPDGGIGDIILSRSFVYHLRQVLPKAHISICFKNKSVLDLVFKNQNLADTLTTNGYKKDYDLIFSGMRIFSLEVKNKLAVKKFAHKFIANISDALEKQKYFKVFRNTPCALEFPFISYTLALGKNVRQMTLWLNGLDDRNIMFPPYVIDNVEEQKTIKKFKLLGKRYITIHDGFDTNLNNNYSRNMKCWPRANWEYFIKLFKQKYPDILIVQLGAKNSKSFKGVDISLINKTTLLPLPHLLNNAILHIDGESGLTHLRSALCKVSVVMIGPSTEKYSLYDTNINIISRNCGGCMDIKNNWAEKCMLSLGGKDCMSLISPERVLNAVQDFFEGKTSKEIKAKDLLENPYQECHTHNFKCLQEMSKKQLPLIKISSRYYPVWLRNILQKFISK